MAEIRVKICCIVDEDEAALAVRSGASALGLISKMPSGPGVIDERTIAAIVRLVPSGVATFLRTAECESVAIIDQQRRCRANVLQLVDRVDPAVYERLRVAIPGVALVQVVHIVDAGAIQEAVQIAAHVDAILLDSGAPAAAIPELGGTGRVHDWRVSAALRKRIAKPIDLAGGLRPDNVAAGIRAVRPFGVDLCSGVRSAGRLDPQKLQRFMDAVAAA